MDRADSRGNRGERERERERESCDGEKNREGGEEGKEKEKASVLMERLSYPTETVLSDKISRSRIVLSCKDSPRKPLGRRSREKSVSCVGRSAEDRSQGSKDMDKL